MADLSITAAVHTFEGSNKFGGDEIVSEGLCAILDGQSGRLQMTVQNKNSGKSCQLGLCVEHIVTPGEEIVIRLQRQQV